MIVVCTAVLCTHLCTHQVYTVQSQCAVEGKVVSGQRSGWGPVVSGLPWCGVSSSDREQLCPPSLSSQTIQWVRSYSQSYIVTTSLL